MGERRPEVLTMGSTNGRITPNEKLSSSGSAATKQINNHLIHNALDGKSVQDVFEGQRGQIVDMMNQALNDQGKEAVL